MPDHGVTNRVYPGICRPKLTGNPNIPDTQAAKPHLYPDQPPNLTVLTNTGLGWVGYAGQLPMPTPQPWVVFAGKSINEKLNCLEVH